MVGKTRPTGPINVIQGASAYAFKQADVLRRMAVCCAAMWIPELRKHGIEPSWQGKYSQVGSSKVEEIIEYNNGDVDDDADEGGSADDDDDDDDDEDDDFEFDD